MGSSTVPYNPYETALYRHFDADGRLLYVGISMSLLARQAAHMLRAHWSRQIVSITVERFPTREAAIAAELRAILSEKPLHNVVGVPAVEEVIDEAAEMEKLEKYFAAHRYGGSAP